MPRTGTSHVSQADAARLTKNQRDMLVEHIDGELDVNQRDPHLVGVRNSLIAIGMLRGATSGIRPRATVLTERGRMALGMVLGSYADSLVRAGFLERQHTHYALEVLRSGRKAPVSADLALAPILETLQKL